MPTCWPARTSAASCSTSSDIPTRSGTPAPAEVGEPSPRERAQAEAIAGWLDGRDPSGPPTVHIDNPTLVADGTEDALDPVANDHILAATIAGSQLALYPGAGHAFLFQDTATFVPAVETLLSARPYLRAGRY